MSNRWVEKVQERSLTKNDHLVRSGKIETRPACQGRDEENKYFWLLLKSINQGHACMKR